MTRSHFLAGVGDAPRRVTTVHPGMKEADLVSSRIPEICLAPKPGLILRLHLKLDPRGLHLVHCRIEIFELEVDDNTAVARNVQHAMNRERGAANRAFEARVVGRAAHNLAEAERSVERH